MSRFTCKVALLLSCGQHNYNAQLKSALIICMYTYVNEVT